MEQNATEITHAARVPLVIIAEKVLKRLLDCLMVLESFLTGGKISRTVGYLLLVKHTHGQGRY